MSENDGVSSRAQVTLTIASAVRESSAYRDTSSGGYRRQTMGQRILFILGSCCRHVERLRGVFTTRRYTDPRLPLPLSLRNMLRQFVHK